LRSLAEPAQVPPAIFDAETVVIVHKKVKDISQVQHPIQAGEFDAIYQNIMGAKFEGKGLVAQFALSVLSKDNEVRVVRENRPECRYRLEPKKMK
jgi:hypothetical protein